uniref:Uncharacterized protein AlNc14C27G2614 n=1 Tax=Albugo laibachii Nc14 TaxID=890382 RepID=F0W6X8_9STRA|nr:hypothetical protein SS1G_13224 [Albugo laibachii Nc14]|eukprot:CCA16873.1 hypothetical protein SS1G_13224 [Albugo laibachii Nc14]
MTQTCSSLAKQKKTLRAWTIHLIPVPTQIIPVMNSMSEGKRYLEVDFEHQGDAFTPHEVGLQDEDGKVERYKARMVACGNEQSFGKDCTLTFAAVMDMTTGKVILALLQIWGVPARHGDVSNAYVKASTKPDLNIYLYVPQGMKAGRLLSQLLHSELLRLGFMQCVADSCLYFKDTGDDKTVVGVYVDDLLATATSQERVDEFFVLLTALLIKDLGDLNKFSGMRITHSADFGYKLDQEATIAEMLMKFGLQDAHSVMTPIGLDHDNNTREVDALLPKESAVGA